jgi:hypothetical protein
MRILHQMRRKAHHRFVKKLLNEYLPLPKIAPSETKTVALIFDATILENRKIVEAFAQKLRNKGKRVTLIAFFNDKTKPSLPFNFFNKKEITWKGIPNNTEADNFLRQEYDILYCLFTGENLPLEYIGAMTKAHFKVGPYTDDLTRYDFMIDTQNTDLQYFINQIEFYITKITKSQQHELSTV